MERNGTQWNAMERNGTQWNETELNGTNGTRSPEFASITEQSGTLRNSSRGFPKPQVTLFSMGSESGLCRHRSDFAERSGAIVPHEKYLCAHLDVV